MARSPDRWPVTRAALVEAGRATLTGLRGIARGPARVRMPEGLLFAPQDLRTPDPAVAGEMAAGLFIFGGKTVTVSPGTSPFDRDPPSPDWAEAFYGFGWLRHLRAAGTEEAGRLARALVSDGLASRRRVLDRGAGRRPAIVARRVVSLLAHSPIVLTGADHTLYHRYLRRLGRDVAALGRAMRDAPVPGDRLMASIALLSASLCSRGLEGWVKTATAVLAQELDAQILPDGGPVDRNPGTLVALLLDLMPLGLLFSSRAVDVPPALDRAIDRMIPMLRFFRLGSGDLALFNGMGPTPLGELAAILAQDRAWASHAPEARASGYDRLEAGRTVVIVDTGGAPTMAVSGAANAGSLSFTLSSGLHELVVNGGAPPRRGDAARLTAAHSTLVLGGEPTGFPLGAGGPGGGWAAGFLLRRFGPVLLGGVRDASAERTLSDAGDQILTARHDGYRDAFGAVHTRRLRLAGDGGELEGEDTVALSGSGPEPGLATLRFHLHPAVQASAGERGGAIQLELPGGERWHFGAEDAVPVLEDSVLYAVPEGRRPTRQIVVTLPIAPGARQLSVRWLFLRA